ncbi:MAG: hypothetical protein ACI9JZ_002642 [Lentimonas sp.]|jgi:hypothetical protein
MYLATGFLCRGRARRGSYPRYKEGSDRLRRIFSCLLNSSVLCTVDEGTVDRLDRSELCH